MSTWRRVEAARAAAEGPLLQVRCVESTGPAPVCKVIPPRGCIQPGLHVDIDVVYSPNSTGTHTVDTFEIFTPGGNKVGGRPLPSALLSPPSAPPGIRPGLASPLPPGPLSRPLMLLSHRSLPVPGRPVNVLTPPTCR